MSDGEHLSRREFLKHSSAGMAAAGVLATAGQSRASTAREAERRSGANDRLVFGMIGVGGMGSYHVDDLLGIAQSDNLEIGMVCDVFAKRARRNAEKVQCPSTGDYRKLLDNPDIDCVIIATPDHWHFKNALDALDAGKHVFLQKPMTHTIAQAIQLRRKVQKSPALVFQVGAQHTGEWKYWSANDLIQKGQIGDVVWSQTSVARNSREGEWNYPIDSEAGPGASGVNHIDWDMWLGHKFGCAPKVAWNPEHFFRFRKYWAYSGGIATDLFYHKLAPFLLAIEGKLDAFPEKATANGGIYVQKDGREVPDTLTVTLDYPGDHTLVMTGSMANDNAPPNIIRGQFGTIHLEPARIPGGQVVGQKIWMKEFLALSGGRERFLLTPPDDWNEERRGQWVTGHTRNFIDVIRGRQNQLNCPVELATAAQVGISMGVEAYRQQKTLRWNPMKWEAEPA